VRQAEDDTERERERERERPAVYVGVLWWSLRGVCGDLM